MTTRLARMSLVAALLTVPCISDAQIVGSQGAIDAEHHFRSPMVLQLPLPNVRNLPEGTRIAVSAEIGGFTCEDVSIETLTVEHKAGTRHTKGKLITEFAGSIRVPESFDRMIDVSLVVKKGEVNLGKTTMSNIDAEEGRSTPFRAPVVLDEAQIVDAFASEPHPTLEITVKVRDNS